MSIDAKEAVESAVAYLGQFIEGAENINFEEFEIVDTPPRGERIDITLSFNVKGELPFISAGPFEKMAETLYGVPMGPRRPRYYRVIGVDSDTGRIRAMKVRHRL